MVSEDEKRVIAYHEAGHALLAHIVGRGMTIHKVTIVPRGGALGYNMYLPTDERLLATRDDLITRIVVLLGGRAGEQVALGEVSNGAGDDLERSTAIARAMVFDWGLGESLTTRTVRADNFALSEDTKRQRDQEQSQICDYAYAEALRLLEEHRERSSASPPSCWSARRSTARTSPRCCTTCSAWARSPSAVPDGPAAARHRPRLT